MYDYLMYWEKRKTILIGDKSLKGHYMNILSK